MHGNQSFVSARTFNTLQYMIQYVSKFSSKNTAQERNTYLVKMLKEVAIPLLQYTALYGTATKALLYISFFKTTTLRAALHTLMARERWTSMVYYSILRVSREFCFFYLASANVSLVCYRTVETSHMKEKYNTSRSQRPL
jgi:hypothetical protein